MTETAGTSIETQTVGRRTSLDVLDAAVHDMGGQARAGQRQLVEAVDSVLEGQHHLVAQAPTGAGKGLGYLAPSVAQGRKVVVSTATIALQDQLVGKDLPQLKRSSGLPFRYARLKGRGQYLCLHKLDIAEKPGTLFETAPGEDFLSELDLCRDLAETAAAGSGVGDRSDIEVSDKTWRAVSVGPNECPGASRCARGDDCLAEKARDQARDADVLVVNHALYAQHLANGASVLEEHDVAIFDEAHAFANAATSAYSETLNPAGLEWVAARARSAGIGDDNSKALSSAAINLANVLAVRDGRINLQTDTALGAALEACAVALSSSQNTLMAKARARKEDAPSDPDSTDADMVAKTLASRYDAIQRILVERASDVIYAEKSGRAVVLVCAPVDVSEELGQAFEVQPAVFVSATLGGQAPFDAFASGIGLDSHAASGPVEAPVWSEDGEEDAVEMICGKGYESLDVTSPFDWQNQALLYVPKGRVCEPNNPDYINQAGDELVTLINAAGGRTLVLCTSNANVRKFTDILRAKTSHTILAQGDAGRATLAESFRRDEQSCLVATRSFWEGLDVPGSACVLVVIDRLPFPSPADPLMQARRDRAEARGANGWRSVDLPACALALAQGVGRLMRDEADHGVVCVLDVRLATKSYRNVLLAGLPGVKRSINQDEAIDRLAHAVKHVAHR